MTLNSNEAEANERDPQTYAIIGACMAVHGELGHGFLEAVYQEALEIEFTRRGIPFVREKRLRITYAGVPLTTYYEADFICNDSIVVELKALSALDPAHMAQVINALKATGQLGQGPLHRFQVFHLVLGQRSQRAAQERLAGVTDLRRRVDA